ncbi:hypothetical protein BM536_008745 [Streptomyces phaeoluteigriseus]|uniref:Uncharacterized protein n=1 Tax=Streptomyces phaeoluteigriseus TaxID=114686 RepID=A0A1V6MV52_9ACTN|nr:hypothetical protein [Streptomyces phaeoluteigriseus]OQD56350.1 hypothetical protein BM536_008745 [Streptomyces phaeoluteigriseus]
MREQSVADQESSVEEEVKGKKRIDLSVPQVAGSAVAAVVAAELASYFGVYGTILGVGVVSVVATCGGTVFQHFFSRTGEQFREAAVVPRPSGANALAPGEYSAGTVHRARVRSWRRPVVAAALVFGVTMGGITAYELTAGGDGGTTVGDALSGTTASSSGTDPDPDDAPATDGTGTAPTSPESAATGAATPSADGTASESPQDDDGGTASPEPTPSASATRETETGAEATPTPTGAATAPEPSASSRSGTAGQDPAGPATP